MSQRSKAVSMMMSLPPILVLLCLFLAAEPTDAISLIQPDREQQGLRGAVSTVTERHAAEGSPWALVSTMKFDRLGYMTEVSSWSEFNDKMPPRASGLRTTFSYDRRRGQASAISRGFDGSPYQEAYYRYNQAENTEVEVTYQGNSFVRLKVTRYSANNQRTELTTYSAHPPHFSQLLYRYDSKEGATTITSIPEGTMSVEFHDPEGRVTEARTYLESGQADLTTLYHYDDHGNILEATTHLPDNSVKGKFKHAYEYDNAGNWTEHVTKWIVKEGQSANEITVMKRALSYFDEERSEGKGQPE